MRLFVATIAFALMGGPALADCKKLSDGVFLCEPAEKAPTCKYFEGKLLCTAPIDRSVKPSNCAWVKDKYVCS